MTSSAAPRDCLVCGRRPIRTLALAAGHRLLRCPRCGLGWWDWPPFDPARFYDHAYFQSAEAAKGYEDYAALEAGARCTARARLRQIEALLARQRPTEPGGVAPRRLFDIGCASGYFLAEAARRGWQGAGSDVSPYASEQARRRGLSVITGPIDQIQLEPASFDCVALWDVLEHLPRPDRVLAQAAAALRPGGVLALSTGDVTSLCARLSGPHWHLFSLPEHLFFFSPRSLRRLLARCGCRVLGLRREVNWVPVSYVLERLGKTIPALRGARRAMRAVELLLPATLGDVLGVYALRT